MRHSNYRVPSFCFAKHSLHRIGLSFLGLKGTFASPPHTAQVAVKYSLGLVSILSLLAAFLASLGLVLEALFCIEFLFACSEYKFLSAFLADQSFVLVHNHIPRFNLIALGRIFTDTSVSSTLIIELHGQM